MLKDLLEILQEFIRKLLGSRIFVLSLVFTGMFSILIVKLFHLQIDHGEEFQADYVQKTETRVTTPGTRGNIYDVNGNLLAYNELAYMVNIRDTGDYPDSQSMNSMLLRLVHILNKHGYDVQGKLELALDENGDMIYTSGSEAARKRFLRDFYGRKSVDELDDPAGKYPSAVTAREVLNLCYERYGMD